MNKYVPNWSKCLLCKHCNNSTYCDLDFSKMPIKKDPVKTSDYEKLIVVRCTEYKHYLL